MKNKNKNLGLMICLAFSVLLFSGLGSGVGFKKVVEAVPGVESNEIIRLQNLAEGDPDLKFTGTVISGEEIVSLGEGGEYNVPNGNVKDAPLIVKLPADAEIGQSYEVNMVFRSVPLDPVASPSGNAVQFTQSTGFSFDVVAVAGELRPPIEPQDGSDGGVWLWVIGVLLFFVILWLVFRKKN